MLVFPSRMKILPVLGTFAVLIAGQDTKILVFPPTSGNDSSLETEGKIEPMLQSDMTRAIFATLKPPRLPPSSPPPSSSPPPPPLPPPPHSMLPSDYFFHGKDFSILVTLRERDGVV
jgi:hypothetical protein